MDEYPHGRTRPSRVRVGLQVRLVNPDAWLGLAHTRPVMLASPYVFSWRRLVDKDVVGLNVGPPRVSGAGVFRPVLVAEMASVRWMRKRVAYVARGRGPKDT